jgi:hypothetical protein
MVSLPVIIAGRRGRINRKSPDPSSDRKDQSPETGLAGRFRRSIIEEIRHPGDHLLQWGLIPGLDQIPNEGVFQLDRLGKTDE